MVKVFAYFNSKQRSNRVIHMEEIIKPIYIVSSLLGLFPYSVKFIKSKQLFEVTSRSLYINSLCGLTIIMTIFAFSILHIQDVFMSSENVTMTEAIMTQMNYVLELITFIIFCTVSYICAFINRRKYVKVLNMITTTWFDLLMCGNSQNILERLQFHVNVACGSLVLVLVVQICVNFTRNNSLWKIILVGLTFNLAQTIQFVTLALYYSLVMMLIAVLTNINEHCLSLTNDKKLIEKKEPYKVKSKSMVTLCQIEVTYVKAFEIKTYINKIFQGPILASTLQCFHSVVSESHIIYHGVVVQQTLTTHEVINCSIWIAYQILKIYIMSYAGNILKLEAMKIGQRIHNVPTDKRDMRWLMEVQHFASLMSYQKIEMTIYEYFPLDGTLLYNMLSSAMMYLIILVQFDK